MDEIIVRLQDVTKRIGKRTIIDRLTLDLPRGEVFGFLGPNGAGKTTTIRMMVGLMSLTSGQILIDGHSITKDYEKAIRHVGAIVENPEMYKYLTGYQNLIHYARMIPGVTSHRVKEVVSLVGLTGRIHDKVKTYSLGMRQRLGVAQAILHNPKLLILDEPTNGLDPAGMRELRDYIRNLAKNEGIAVFVSSHMLSEMELMCDRVAIIQNGKLIDVRQIQGMRDTLTITSIIFEVNSTEAAIDALVALGTNAEVAGPNHIAFQGDKEMAATVNAALVQAGLKVYSIRAEAKSLEDQFLEVTGGESVG
ncbi:ABC transporter ATP-binding protein [Paenibacillus sp. GSMTC-2017]|uniref:ABC transporter ATP-binding protein n=1 Tax=Paenibacillus sp. GSMTC-2017 TaxID=2794350 RepID=UPI0018D7D4C3|nr:ABC transporter ATP-binding protein [Paenibacillus sp. GSMTC-2017]MBH5319133.1 ABC transporter ATP-binding protein [Paenibacillus sp. GSMTC-2017]